MINIFSLFYSDRFSSIAKPVNSNRKHSNHNDIYLKNAFLLQKSLADVGIHYAVITNDGKLFDDFFQKYGYKINYQVVCFSWKIPTNIKFYGAHFKLELFEKFGTGAFGEKILLLDLDMIATPKIKDLLTKLEDLKNNTLVYYNVASIEFDFQQKREHQNGVKIFTEKVIPPFFWAGGEFIFGSVDCFKNLSLACKNILPVYFSYCDRLPHVGDEMVVNVVFNQLKGSINLTEVGQLGLINPVVRFWSAGTSVDLPGFDSFKDVCLFHLPADKEFLSYQSSKDFNYKDILLNYRRLVFKKSLFRRIFYMFSNINSAKRYPPKL